MAIIHTSLLNFYVSTDCINFMFQLSFESFSVGTFESFTSGGCPDGFISIRESNRPSSGGKWCGSAWGYTVYYSETSSLNLTLSLDRLPQQVCCIVSVRVDGDWNSPSLLWVARLFEWYRLVRAWIKGLQENVVVDQCIYFEIHFFKVHKYLQL